MSLWLSYGTYLIRPGPLILSELRERYWPVLAPAIRAVQAPRMAWRLSYYEGALALAPTNKAI